MANDLKRKIVAVFRRNEVSLQDAAEMVGVSAPEARQWLREDADFKQAMHAAALAKCLQFIADAFGLALSDRELTEAEIERVDMAGGLYDYLCGLFPELRLTPLSKT